ncbi:MAG: ABC transporter permease [Cyclobacteriaceae bacterium]|nr:ABC transporter permease [Cytophagales bacterium]HNP76039.1 ABC transporter permease [Cyclobacteriaceae bacterium]HQQ82595.1 ABC transporter permease [Cyclobacteriaceae bacterium]
MLYNYLKIAFRNITKHSVYSAINIAGLSVGLASSALIFLWVADEMSFNKFHKNYDDLYQVYMNQSFADGIATDRPVPLPLLEAAKAKVSEIQYMAVANWGEGSLLTHGDTKINKNGLAVSEDFLKMFSFPVIKGTDAALADPNSIILTEATAKALFGDEDPLNKTILVDNQREVKVGAIVQDVPVQSSLKFEYLMPFTYFEAHNEWVQNSRKSWGNHSFQMFVQLHAGASLDQANASIKDIVKENNPKEDASAELFLYPLSQLRLHSQFENGKPSGGMIEYVQLFSAIAAFILIIACINFMNLATARSESRAREVGIRKSIGSRRKELIAQFLGESLLITTLAFITAIVIIELALPLYNQLVNKQLLIEYSNPWLWFASLVIIVVTGVVSGSYPALYLSAFQPAKVLKGKVHAGKQASTPRKVLVTLQFGLSIFLIIGTLVIYQQIQHVKNRTVGYDKENLMMIWTTAEIETNFESVRQQLMATGVVKSVAHSNSPITDIFSSNTVEWAGMDPGKRVNFSTIASDYDYTATMGIKLLAGRDFSRDFKSDSSAVLINQAAADVMGMAEPVGKQLDLWGGKYNIIGVMDNVVMDSPFQPVAPLILVFQPDWSSTVSIRLEKTDDLKGSIAKVEDVMKKINPNYPFAYRFADWAFDQKFGVIDLISRLSSIFAGLAIFITCLGLFGLAAFTAEQRTKEIGIRKVMGATVTNLVTLITRDFSRLVLIAFVLSAPLGWWALNWFLSRYPYRVDIAWWVFPAAGGLALVLAVTIVGMQALRAAVANPTQSLRSE